MKLIKFAGGPSLICALAALLLALAPQLSSGTYDERALALATLAAAFAVAATLWWRRGGATGEPALPVQFILGAGSVFGLAGHLLGNPTLRGDPRALAGGFRWLALTALVLLSAYLCVHLRASLMKARFLLLLGCFVFMGVAVLKSSPYSAGDPNIHGPLSAQMLAPFLFGDVRYGLLFLMTGAAFLLSRAARNTSGELAALFILFQPRTFFVLEQACPEPLVLACFAGAALAIASRKGPLLAAAVVAALLLASAAAAWLLTLHLNKQAFCNYDWLGAGLLSAAAVLPARNER